MSDDSFIPEQRLMQAVILTAIADACGEGSDGRTPANIEADKVAALAWIADAGTDFQSVCEVAGFDHDEVRKLALEFVESGKPFPRVPRANRTNHARTRNPSSPAAIAAHAGVSEAAVRNVLRHNTGSRDMKRRVHAAHRELNEQAAA